MTINQVQGFRKGIDTNRKSLKENTHADFSTAQHSISNDQ
jgi:hypothetical protein